MNENRRSEQTMTKPLTPCGRTRREFLWESAGGFVGTALATLLAEDGFFARSASAALDEGPIAAALAPKKPHFPAKAKSCIVLFMYGGVSQVDTFDPKSRAAQARRQADSNPRSTTHCSRCETRASCWRRRAGSRVTARPGPPSPTCSRTWQSASTTSLSSAACTPTASRMDPVFFR